MVFRDSGAGAVLRQRCRTDGGQLRLQLLLPLVQFLEPELPAMQLDAVLIDVAADFSSLRLVFLQLLLKLGSFARSKNTGFGCAVRDHRWFATRLTRERQSGGCGIHDQRTGAVLTDENNVAVRVAWS